MGFGRQFGFWLVALLVLIAFLWLLSAILLPFIAGLVLAYFLDPVADALERLGLPRIAATLAILILIVFGLALILFLLLPVLGEQIASFAKTPNSERQYCKICGGHIMANHPTFGLVDVFAATIPSFPFSPQLHVNYSETVLPMKDGLPKFKDFPPGLGTGETVPE